jgi:hypothetical protein
MYYRLLISLFIIFPLVIVAQEDSSLTRKEKNINPGISDTAKLKNLHLIQIPPRSLIIKLKDLEKMRGVDEKSFIIEDTLKYSKDELASGLSEKELGGYKKNKEELKNLYKPPVSEEDTYPTLAKTRKFLEVAKKVGAVIILILSLL